jgi:hypothetical protein
MNKFINLLILPLVILLISNTGNFAQEQNIPQKKQLNWYKGNTHTHTINSDGDSTPDEVVRWYREHRYNFLVLTDHNFLTNVDGLNSIHGAEEQFIVIRGEEVTDTFDKKPVHINGLNVERLVKPQGGGSVAEVIQRNVNEIRSANGVPHINHPNFDWAITAEDIKKVENNKLFEIFNGHPLVNNLGGGGKPGLEEMWDKILSAGILLYGIAVDDAHNFKNPGNKKVAQPGQGWIYVRADRLTPRAILEALENGEFYASTGVELKDYQADKNKITINIREEPRSKYHVQFIGKDGKLLSEVISNPAVYQIKGDEGYVRAKIIESNGKLAWTQPVMLDKK